MSTQISPVDYAKCIQYQLFSIVDPVPVYASFNRNYANEPKFLTWQIRDIHQPVYTGQTQSNRGIDTPTFQVSIFAQNMSDAFNLSNDILQSLNGYSGMFGNPQSVGFWIAKIDARVLYNNYDNELGLHGVYMDCTLYVPA
jgi:hypothetical protein